MKIHISSDLHERLVSLGGDPDSLIDDFREWKGDPYGRQTMVFGRDVANVGSQYVRHAHMIPINDANNLALWKKIHGKNRKYNRH